MDTKLLLLSAVRFLCVKVASVVCNTRYGPCHGCDSFRFLPIHCWGTSPRPSHPDGKHEPLHGGHISSLIGPEPPEWKWLPIPGLKIIFHCSWGGAGREPPATGIGDQNQTEGKRAFLQCFRAFVRHVSVCQQNSQKEFILLHTEAAGVTWIPGYD